MAKRTRIKWHGDEFKKKTLDHASDNLQRAGFHLQRSMQEEIGKQAPFIRRGRKTIGRVGSVPPLPPHKRTGFLQRNVVHEHDKAALISRIGVSKAAIYGLSLELGTRFSAARPWMRLALAKQRAVIAGMIGRFKNLT